MYDEEGKKMAIRYLDDKNKHLSGYVVSGKQSSMIRKAVIEKSSKDVLASIKNTTSSVRAIIAKTASRN